MGMEVIEEGGMKTPVQCKRLSDYLLVDHFQMRYHFLSLCCFA